MTKPIGECIFGLTDGLQPLESEAGEGLSIGAALPPLSQPLTMESQQMNTIGFAKLPRWLETHPRNHDSQFIAVVVWLSLRAAFTEGQTGYFKGVRISLKAGQLLTGRKQLHSLTGYPESNVATILRRLQREQLIERQSDNVSSLITCKWFNDCQTPEQQGERQPEQQPRRQGEQPRDGNLNTISDIESDRDKIKKRKELSSPPDKPPEVKGYSDFFQAFWKECPPQAKSRSGRDKAYSIWKNLALNNKTSFEFVMGRLKLWKNSDGWKKQDGEFIPGIHIWLRDGRYKEGAI